MGILVFIKVKVMGNLMDKLRFPSPMGIVVFINDFKPYGMQIFSIKSVSVPYGDSSLYKFDLGNPCNARSKTAVCVANINT